ncbi:MAG: helix-turn-helix domain-containing protein [Lentisphaeria bacterium]|nr:helix-turn-helix domain-containing protein [Lentisphaeria bacterium]
MAEKHKKIALSHIAEMFAENKSGIRNIWFSGGVSANFDFVPENILAWTSRESSKVTGTFIHQRMALALVLSGKCVMNIDGVRIPMNPGEMVCILPFQFHTIRLDCPPEEYQTLWITFTEKKGDYSSFFSLKNRLLKPDRSDFACIAEIVQGTLKTETPAEKTVLALLKLLLNFRRKKQSLPESSEPRTLFDRMCDYIRNNFEKEISVKTLADEFSVSTETVRRHFRNADTGLTPHELLILLRHQLAIELLEQTDLSIAEIAAKCGWSDPFSFSRAFKKRDHLSPLQHRKKFR